MATRFTILTSLHSKVQLAKVCLPLTFKKVILSFLYSIETENKTTAPAVLPPAKLFPDEKDSEVH